MSLCGKDLSENCFNLMLLNPAKRGNLVVRICGSAGALLHHPDALALRDY